MTRKTTKNDGFLTVFWSFWVLGPILAHQTAKFKLSGQFCFSRHPWGPRERLSSEVIWNETKISWSGHCDFFFLYYQYLQNYLLSRFKVFSPYKTWIFLTFNLDQKQFWTIFVIQMVVTHPIFDYFRRPSHVGAWPPHVMPVCQRLLDTYMCIASIEMCPFLYKMNSRIISFTFGCFGYCLALPGPRLNEGCHKVWVFLLCRKTLTVL